MDKETEKQIEEHIALLPKKTREALKEFDWASRLEEIGDRHGLLLDELSQLHIDTTLTLVGLLDPDDYQINLRRHLGVSEALSTALVKDVSATIFQPIQEMIFEKDEEKPEESSEMNSSASSEPKNPKREDILAGIEDPEQESAPQEEKKDIAQLKLNDIFTKKPTSADGTQDSEQNNSQKPPSTKQSYDEVDPYHEPID